MRFSTSGFLWISFPQAPEYTIRVRIFSKIRWDIRSSRWPVSLIPVAIEKIFNQKSFNYFLTPLCSRINIWINFFLHVHFKLSTVWHCCHYLPPVSLTPVANLPPVSLIPAAIFHRCCWYRWCTFTCKYLCEFLKKIVMNQMLFSGAWGKMIHEKNLKQKISSHCSFNAINSHLPAL